jgi:SAM-dependent methyltransferase
MSDYIDRIGDRLDHPERVPKEYAHLIADDRQRVERILSIPVSGRVLDVGCSDGAITRRIAETWGIAMPIGADLRATECDYGLTWDCRTPWPYLHLAPFDAVYACEVFEHMTAADADFSMGNICAVLKPGGSLILTVPNRHPHDLYEVGCRSRWAWPDHRSSWTAEHLWNWLGHWGFGEWHPLPLYDGERFEDSIWLIVEAKARRCV